MRVTGCDRANVVDGHAARAGCNGCGQAVLRGDKAVGTGIDINDEVACAVEVDGASCGRVERVREIVDADRTHDGRVALGQVWAARISEALLVRSIHEAPARHGLCFRRQREEPDRGESESKNRFRRQTEARQSSLQNLRNSTRTSEQRIVSTGVDSSKKLQFRSTDNTICNLIYPSDVTRFIDPRTPWSQGIPSAHGAHQSARRYLPGRS